MKLTYGLEQEFFVELPDGTIEVPVPKTLPHDDSGVLLEARGKPFSSITEAVFSLKASVHDLSAQLTEKFGNAYRLDDSPVRKLTKTQKFAVRRQFEKGVNSYQNLYGFEYHRTRESEHTAAVHISFSNPVDVRQSDGRTVTVLGMFDFVSIFRKLDVAFKDEISESYRRPGFYEVKSDGRVEYRSLPANVNLDKVIDVIKSMNP